VGKHNEDTHLFLYLVLAFFFFLHSLKYKPFNYARVSMWHSISLAGLYWLALINTLDHMSDENQTYIILLFTGWGLLVCFGLVFQKKKHPSMLITLRHPDLM
jgi:hypothetical protein